MDSDQPYPGTLSTAPPQGRPAAPPPSWDTLVVPKSTHTVLVRPSLGATPSATSQPGGWTDPSAATPQAVFAPPAVVTPTSAAAESAPQPGSLGIKERRSWKTWHLLAFMLGALVLGMGIESVGRPSASLTSASSTKTYTPPPASGGSAAATTVPATTTTVARAGAGAGAATTTTVAPTTAGASSGQPQVLVPRFQSQGNWTSPAFTITSGTWYIGWQYRCTPTPPSGPAFQVFVVPNGGSPSGAAAVTAGSGTGQAITPQTSTGAQQIIVQAPAGCVWVVKVTGVGSA